MGRVLGRIVPRYEFVTRLSHTSTRTAVSACFTSAATATEIGLSLRLVR